MLAAVRRSLTRDAAKTAERWAEAGPALLDYFEELRKKGLGRSRRTRAFEGLRERARDLGLYEEDNW